MAGVKQHRQGIQISFYWNRKRYRPTLQIPATAANIKYATRLAGEVERAIALGTYTLEDYARHFPTSGLAQAEPQPSGAESFNKIAAKWLKASSHLSPGTLIKYEQSLEFWKLHVGELPVDEIQYSTIAMLANSQGWKAKHRNNMLIPLRRVMEMAFLDGLIDANPAERIKNAKVQKEPPDPLTAPEVEEVLQHVAAHYHPQIFNAFEFAFFTGMRPSELISLQWGDIDQKRSIARVRRAKTFKQTHATKTYKVRDVELNTRALKTLERQKQYTFMKRGVVFENPVTDEEYLEERPLRRAYWNPTLLALGMRSRNFYQTRHTYATLNLMAGANPMWVAKQLGHVNSQMLHTVYARWIEGADKSQEKAKIDTLFTDLGHHLDTKPNKTNVSN